MLSATVPGVIVNVVITFNASPEKEKPRTKRGFVNAALPYGPRMLEQIVLRWRRLRIHIRTLQDTPHVPI